MTRTRLRIASRIARREVRLHPWRHLLVVGLIFLPALLVIGVFSAADTWKATSDRADAYATAGQSGGHGEFITQNRDWTLGVEDPPPLDPSALPDGTVIEERWRSGDWLVTDRERSDGAGPQLVGAEVLEMADGSLASGRAVVRTGRLSRTSDEIALTPALAAEGPWQIGDVVTSARSERTFTVVGIAALGDATERPAAMVADLPDSYWTQPIGALREVRLSDGTWVASRGVEESGIWLPAGADPAVLRVAGAEPVEPSVSPDDRLGLGFVMSAAGLGAIVAVVASAAFALAARRQLRSVGLLATAGADPATIRASLVLQGALPGLVAGVLAVVAAMVAVRAAERWDLVERVANVEGATPVLSVMGAIVALALGVAAGVAAAWQPAATASRIPVLSALAGRRPVGPVRTRVPVGGLALWVGGAVMLGVAASIDGDGGIARRVQPFLAIGGVIAVGLGGVGLAPMLVALVGRGAVHVGGSLRLVLRGLSRNRTQSAATVAAVGVALALPVALLTFRAGEERKECCVLVGGLGLVGADGAIQAVPREGVLVADPPPAIVEFHGRVRGPDGEAAIARVRDVLGPESVGLRGVTLVDGEGEWTYVAEVEAGAEELFAPWAAEALRDGRALAIGNGRSGSLSLVAEGREVDLEAVGHPEGLPADWTLGAAAYVVGAEALGGVGAGRPSDWIVVGRAAPATQAERDALADLVGDGYDSAGSADPTLQLVREQVGTEPGPFGLDPTVSIQIWPMADASVVDAASPMLPRSAEPPWTRALLVLAAGSSLMALLVLTTTLSLRAVDGRDDRRAAVAAGAPPNLLRRQRAVEGGVLAALGAVLALPLGWIPIAAVQASDEELTTTLLPGVEIVPVLLVPVVLVSTLWWAVPTVGAWLRQLRGRPSPDEVLPRW